MATFIRVVRLGSVTRAASELSLAPSSVSRRIATLEKAIGVTLLERTTRRLTPTDAGRLYLERASAILEAVRDLNQTIAGVQSVPRGRLRITAPIAFGERHLVEMLRPFMSEHPELELDLRLSNQRLDLVADDIDLAIRLGPLPDSRLVAARITPVRRVLCASPLFGGAAAIPVSPLDVPGSGLLFFRRTGGLQVWRLRGPDGRLVEIRGPGRLVADSSECVRRAAVLGLGIALLPTWLVADDMAAGRLVQVFDRWTVPNTDPPEFVNVVYAPGRRRSPAVQAFTAFFRAWVGRPARWDRLLSAPPARAI